MYLDTDADIKTGKAGADYALNLKEILHLENGKISLKKFHHQIMLSYLIPKMILKVITIKKMAMSFCH